jgi:phosphoheptose isomerase
MSAPSRTSAPPAPMSGARTKFPANRHSGAISYFRAYSEELARAAQSIDAVAVERAALVLLGAYTRDATVFSCGNGGSAAIANHLQCDHVKGVRADTDLVPRVVSLSSNVELLTAIANDLEYEEVFIHQLQSQARPGDVLVAISSSGASANIVRALTWARDHELQTIALTGFGGGVARSVADVPIHVDCDNYGVVEDLHQAVMHGLAQYIRQSRMNADMVASTTF